MSASKYIVQSGDVLLIPHPSTLSGANADTVTSVTIEWQQRLASKKASYHTGVASVKGKPDSQVLFFIQSEWYTEANPKALPKADGFLELKVDESVRFGQKNSQGEGRFIVYHDTTRNIYQHRFMNSVLRTSIKKIGDVVAAIVGQAEPWKMAVDKFNATFGDPLRKFGAPLPEAGSMYIAQLGDVLLIPVPSSTQEGAASSLVQLEIDWQQSLSNKKASYHGGPVRVQGHAEEDQVLFFIQSEWYLGAANVPNHIGHGAPIKDEKGAEFYAFKIDKRARLGQKNAQGDGRFVVYHDTGRNTYQHRFMGPALRSTTRNLGDKVASMLAVDELKKGAEAVFGDALKEFPAKA